MSEGRYHLHQLQDRVGELGRLLAQLGWDFTLHRLAAEVPEARDRLAYVAQMTEAAATKVLKLVDQSQPGCVAAACEASGLSDRLAALAQHPDLGVGEARAALGEAAAAMAHQALVNRQQAEALSQIMLAQDFQDLSGQVIKKVVTTLDQAQQQLLLLLAQSEGPAAARTDSVALTGPQAPDKAVAQEDVDDLLASLGY